MARGYRWQTCAGKCRKPFELVDAGQQKRINRTSGRSQRTGKEKPQQLAGVQKRDKPNP